MPAILAIFDMVPRWLLVGLLGAMSTVACVERTQVLHTRAELAQAQAHLAVYQAAYEKAARELSENNRRIENLRTKAMEEINDVVDQERGQTAAAVRDGDAARSMLIDATRRLDAAERAAAGHPQALARAEARASAFGELLASCDRVAADLGRDAEGLATQVRGLQRAYQSLIETGASGLLSKDPLADRVQVDPHV